MTATAAGSVGRRSPYTPPEVPAGKVNVTDPDSKRIKANDSYVQGYNAQAVVDERQIVLAAEITNATVDWSQLAPMITATIGELERAGSSGRPETALADAQYWNEQHMDEVIANQHVQVLIPPDGGARDRPKPGWTGGRYTWMRYVLTSELGKRAIPKTQTHDRAGIRSHQTQPRCHAIPQTRPQRGAHRVAITDDDPQPHQAPPSPDRHRGGLKRPPLTITPPLRAHPPPTALPPATADTGWPDLWATASQEGGRLVTSLDVAVEDRPQQH